MSIIQVENLYKSYEYYEKNLGFKSSLKNLIRRKRLVKEAVKGISFSVEKGNIVSFLGPNGAGKTTTMKMLSGILFPTSGTASVLGFTPWERKKEFKKRFSIIMGQKNQLWIDLPANESLYLNKFIYELDDKTYQRSLDHLTEVLDVRDILKVQVRRLSLGERMKVELIAGLLHKPEVVFLDEPTIGLDLIAQQRIREFLKYYNEQTKTTILITSHYLRDIESLCKHTLIINHGQIVFDGPLNQINELFQQRKIFKIQFSEPVHSKDLERYGTVQEASPYTVTLEVRRESFRACAKHILERFPVHDLNIEENSLEEGIVALYQQKKEA